MLNTKFPFYLFVTVFLTLGLSISLQSLFAAWSPPTANPPGNNANPPVYNISGTPSLNNVIDHSTTVNGNLVIGGTLTMGNYLRTNGNWITNDGDANEGIFVATNGYVGLGTNAPIQPLHIRSGAPTVFFNDSDNSVSYMLHTNSDVFYLMRDVNGDGAWDSVPFLSVNNNIWLGGALCNSNGSVCKYVENMGGGITNMCVCSGGGTCGCCSGGGWSLLAYFDVDGWGAYGAPCLGCGLGALGDGLISICAKY